LSSILKALKKIEEDSPPPQTHPSMPKSIASMQAIRSNTGGRWPKVLYLSIVLLGIGVVTVILFSQRRLIIAKIMSIASSEAPTAGEAFDTSRNSVYRAKVPTPSSKPAPKPPIVTRRLPKTQIKKNVSGSADKKFQAGTKPGKRRVNGGASPSQRSPGLRAPDATLNALVKKTLKTGLPPRDSAPAKRVTARKSTRPTAPATSAKQSAKTRSRETYDRITGSKLKLQALAWSDDAVRRMVVINGRIVHEGGSVDGYQVVEIRMEDVIVNAAGKSWRLEFGLRQ
jgi:hypothetical protein